HRMVRQRHGILRRNFSFPKRISTVNGGVQSLIRRLLRRWDSQKTRKHGQGYLGASPGHKSLQLGEATGGPFPRGVLGDGEHLSYFLEILPLDEASHDSGLFLRSQ